MKRRRLSQREFFRGLFDLLRDDRRFASFILAQGSVVLAGMAFSFVAVFGRERLHLDGYQIGLLSTSLLLGNTLSGPILGWAGDRFGHRKMLIVATVCQILGFALSVLSPNAVFLYLATSLLGAGRGSAWINVQPIVCDYASLERRPTYIGLSSTVFGVINVITPVLGGLVAQASGYGPLFVTSIILSIGALGLYLTIVREPPAAARISLS